MACFIYDLDVSPSTNQEDLDAILRLTWALKSSALRNWTRIKFPKMVKFFAPEGKYPGRKVCPIHKNINVTVLFNLHDILRDETSAPAPNFCVAGLENRYLKALRDINLVWDNNYYEKNDITPAQVSGQLQPLRGHGLFQENNCAGCCLRRILSDYNLVAALLIEVRFRTMEYGIEKEVIDYLEAAWHVLGEKYPRILGTKDQTILIRDGIELEAEELFKMTRGIRYRCGIA